MSSFTWLPSGSALGRLLSWLEPVRQSLLAQRPAVRWLLVAVPISVVAYFGYLGASSLSVSSESTYVGSGRSYTWDDLNKIGRALDRQQIPHRVDDLRRVMISESQREQAEAALARLDLGPKLPREIRDQSLAPNLWETLHDREIREHREEEKIVESMIDELHGIVGCFVRLDRPKPSFSLQPTGKPSAFVRLETEGDRQLPLQTVQSITTILRGYEPGLSAESITVVDRRGYKYLETGNPALSVLSHNRAREEELSQEILQQLEWIKGVRVSVHLTESPGPDARSLVGQNGSGRLESAGATGQTTSRPEGKNPESTSPIVAINRPLGAVDSAVGSGQPPSGRTNARESVVEQGRVWVKVPRSYYYQVSMLPGHREPSVDELQKLVAKMDERIKTGLALVVPLTGPAAWTATIDVIPDEVPLNPPPVLPSATDSRRVALDWGIAGALGAMAAALVLLGSWILTARRPAGRLESAPRGLRYHTGSPLSHGPSERVREFVRRNPDSAVSVLERWTNQGGDAA
jgi:hypothetical protein